MPKAFSYVRFSSPEQAKGDSLRRQTEQAEKWSQRNGFELDPNLTIRDLGVSAFRGANAAAGNFGKFLEAVKSGKVPPGSVLIVESFDRISRQGIDEGYDIIKGILKAGVKIVTLSPERVFDRESVRDLGRGALEILVILGRAAEESERKSVRLSEAWADKRRRARAGERVEQSLPTWIARKDGKLVLDPEKAKTVRRLFREAARGMSTDVIANRLHAEGVPVLGPKQFKTAGQTEQPVRWSRHAVRNILTSRQAIGEFQPHKGHGTARRPEGDPIPDYYPAVVTPETFHAVQGALRTRAKVGRGRRSDKVNLFSGLLIDARDGSRLTHSGSKDRQPQSGSKRRPPHICPGTSAHDKKAGWKWSSYPADPFEKSVLLKLRELSEADVSADDDAAGRVDALEAEVAGLDKRIKEWAAKMDTLADVPEVAAKIAEWNVQRREKLAELEQARQDAARPVSEAWGEFRSLASVLEEDNSDEKRLQVQTALRRVISEVWCLFFGVGRLRVAVVQVWFKDGKRRNYLLTYHPGVTNLPNPVPDRKEHSFVDAGIPRLHGGFDLRHKNDATAVEAVIRKALGQK